jgi:glycosyltransferase involved in cell wall biosynthesis
MKILMLGWEYPPHISGGLGTACYGLTRGLNHHGVEVLFVLPRAFGDEDPSHARILGCNQLDPAGRERAAAGLGPETRVLPVDSPLRPYTSAETYARRLREAVASGSPSVQPAPHGAADFEFRGGYGQTLTEEVERYAHCLRELVGSQAFDLIHAHDWMTFPAGLLLKEHCGKPLVCHVHACEYDRAAERVDPGICAIEQMGFDGCDRIVCVSRFTCDLLARCYAIAPEKLRIVHNAPAPEGEQAREPRKSTIDAPIVLFLGRITHQKGPDYFLRAAARVHAARPEVKFVMSGSGDLLPSMVELAAGLGLARSVHFTGFLEGEEVERMYEMADVFVMPSVSEPFGLTPLEAIAQDVPVIVSRQSGVAEVLGSSLQVNYWDVDDLADKILAVLRHRVLRSQLVEDGRHAVSGLKWSSSALKLLSVYGELVP